MIGTRAVVIGIEVIRHRSPKSAYDLVKMKKNKALAESYRIDLVDRIVVEKFRIFPFSFDSAYESVVYKALNA